jgi:hypothetical protein
MTSVRPTLLAYFAVKDRVTPPATVNTMRQHVVDFAQGEGYTLAELFIETLDTGTNKISALVGKVQSADALPTIALLEGTELPRTYADLLANAGAVIHRIPLPVPNEDTERARR